VTVAAVLEHHGVAALLADPLIGLATMEIREEGRSRATIQRDIRAKERAVEALARKYATDKVHLRVGEEEGKGDVMDYARNVRG